MMRELSWDSISTLDYEGLPPDLTPGGVEGRPACWRVETGIKAEQRPTGGIWKSWACTRPVGHTGRHAAGDGEKIRAVWS
jgi:hypothetical protein